MSNRPMGVRFQYESFESDPPRIEHPCPVTEKKKTAMTIVIVRNFDALSKEFRVVRYDQRAHGESSRSKHGLRVSRLAKDLDDLLNVILISEGSQVVLIGCSLIWNYVELFGCSRLAGAVFVDQSPYQEYAFDGSWV